MKYCAPGPTSARHAGEAAAAHALIIFIRPPPFIFFIMPCICSNWLSRRFTSCTCTPAPVAMRRLRLALISSGLRRSSGVMAQMMPSMRLTSRSARPMSAPAARLASWLGSLSINPARPPMFFICVICDRKSLRSKPLPDFTLSASFCAACRSTPFCTSSTSARMSPMPSTRPAWRSASKTSRPSIFSEMPANLIGAPVTWRTDIAAPPRESPSSLVSTTPVSGSASLKALAVFTASWPCMASTMKSVSTGLSTACSSRISAISASSMPRRPAVSTSSTSK